MIYLAVSLVLLGIFFLLFASFAINGENLKSETPIITRKKPITTKQVFSEPKITPKPVRLTAKLFNLRYPEQKNSSELDQKIMAERNLNSIKNSYKPEIFIEPIFEEYELEEDKQVLEFQPSKQDNSPSPVFQLHGTLYLDYTNKIPYDNKRLKEIDWEESHFQHFHRVGKIKMLEFGGQLQFQAGKDSHELNLEQINQIIFYDKAFSMIPNSPTQPSTLVFSDETNSFKRVLTERLGKE